MIINHILPFCFSLESLAILGYEVSKAWIYILWKGSQLSVNIPCHICSHHFRMEMWIRRIWKVLMMTVSKKTECMMRFRPASLHFIPGIQIILNQCCSQMMRVKLVGHASWCMSRVEEKIHGCLKFCNFAPESCKTELHPLVWIHKFFYKGGGSIIHRSNYWW